MTFKPMALCAALAFGLSAQSALAQDMEYLLINSTSMTLVEFYTSPTDVDSWEEDLLGDYVLPAGAEGTVVIADGRTQCDYDLLFVFEDGSEFTDTVDICELNSYELVQ